MTPDQRAKRIAADVKRLLNDHPGLTVGTAALTERFRVPTRLVDFELRRHWKLGVRHRCAGDVPVAQFDPESNYRCTHCHKEWTALEVATMKVETMENTFTSITVDFDAQTPEWPEKMDWFETDKTMHMGLRAMTPEEVLTKRVTGVYDMRRRCLLGEYDLEKS